MVGQIKDFLNDPLGFFIDGQDVLNFWMPFIVQRRISECSLSCGKLCMESCFNFSAGILGKPFIECKVQSPSYAGENRVVGNGEDINKNPPMLQ